MPGAPPGYTGTPKGFPVDPEMKKRNDVRDTYNKKMYDNLGFLAERNILMGVPEGPAPGKFIEPTSWQDAQKSFFTVDKNTNHARKLSDIEAQKFFGFYTNNRSLENPSGSTVVQNNAMPGSASPQPATALTTNQKSTLSSVLPSRSRRGSINRRPSLLSDNSSNSNVSLKSLLGE